MNNSTNSESALDKFVEKIDFAKLDGKPEDFYKAGLAFVENGQFDDGIIEFVKIIKTVSHKDVLFVNAVKELTSMGFSDADISAISGDPEAVKNIIINHFLTPSVPVASKSNNGFLAGAMIITIIIILFGCFYIFSDTSPESYERNGNLAMFATVLLLAAAPFALIALLFLYVSAFGTKKSSSEPQEKTNNAPHTIAKNNKNPDVADLTAESFNTQELSDKFPGEKKAKKENQIDILPISAIVGIVLIVTLLMSLPYLLSN